MTPGRRLTRRQLFVAGTYQDAGANYTNGAYWRGPWHVFGYYIFRHFVQTPFLKKRVRQIHFDGTGVIQPVIWKNFHTGGAAWPAQVNAPNNPPSVLSTPTNFTTTSAQTYGNLDTAQLYGGSAYQGVQMIFGGASTVQEARLYALGTANAWSVEFGNTTSDPFEVDSYMLAIQFRKS